jgi:hypothetical protein
MLNRKKHIKIAHESPNCIFEDVQKITDYDYALVHLLESNIEYRKHFEKACVEREVILDNSIFELGEAFDTLKFKEWVDKLNPTWHIIPDVLEDGKKTVQNAKRWLDLYSGNSKKIAVAQGKNYNELIECYLYLECLDIDMIAMSFDYSFFNGYSNSVEYSGMLGRYKLINDMLKDDVININKPHHLLGCYLPQEFKLYNNEHYNFIYSLDTSNPIVHGINLTQYQNYGLDKKDSIKLHTLIDSELDEIQKEYIMYNINKFKGIVRG